MSRCLPAIAALLVILHCHTPYTQAQCTDVGITLDNGIDNHWLPPKYFAIKDDADNVIIVDPQLSCRNEKTYEILKVTLLDTKDHNIVPYWNKAQILLKVQLCMPGFYSAMLRCLQLVLSNLIAASSLQKLTSIILACLYYHTDFIIFFTGVT